MNRVIASRALVKDLSGHHPHCRLLGRAPFDPSARRSSRGKFESVTECDASETGLGSITFMKSLSPGQAAASSTTVAEPGTPRCSTSGPCSAGSGKASSSPLPCQSTSSTPDPP